MKAFFQIPVIIPPKAPAPTFFSFLVSLPPFLTTTIPPSYPLPNPTNSKTLPTSPPLSQLNFSSFPPSGQLLPSISGSLPSSPSDTDLALRFLSLGGVVVVGGFTVRAVVFTVVIGCSGVFQYQQLLDVTLEEEGEENSLSAEYTVTVNSHVKVFFYPQWSTT